MKSNRRPYVRRENWYTRSRLLDLPEAVRRKVDCMIRTPTKENTYAEIVKWLNEFGFKVSKSTVGRYGKNLLISDGKRKNFEIERPSKTTDLAHAKLAAVVSLVEELVGEVRIRKDASGETAVGLSILEFRPSVLLLDFLEGQKIAPRPYFIKIVVPARCIEKRETCLLSETGSQAPEMGLSGSTLNSNIEVVKGAEKPKRKEVTTRPEGRDDR